MRQPTTWQILIRLQNVTNPGYYTLQLAIASAMEKCKFDLTTEAATTPPDFKLVLSKLYAFFLTLYMQNGYLLRDNITPEKRKK